MYVMYVHHFRFIEAAVKYHFMQILFCSLFFSAFTGLYFFTMTEFIPKNAILRWILLRLAVWPSLRRTLKIAGAPERLLLA